MISPRHEEARKVDSVVRERLKAEGAIGIENYPVSVLRRMDLGPESYRDLLHYTPGRVVGFHTHTAGGFRPGEKWTVRQINCETVTLERNGQVRQFKPSATGKWDVLVSSMMQVSVGDQIRVTAGFREGKSMFKNNDITRVREVNDTELILYDGRRMRRDGARIDQGVSITSHASQSCKPDRRERRVVAGPKKSGRIFVFAGPTIAGCPSEQSMNRLDPLDTAAWPFGGRPPATAQPVHHCCPALTKPDISERARVTDTGNHPAGVKEVTFANLLC